MESVYVQGPNVLDYTPEVATEAGTLVWVNGKCGQVISSVAAGRLGAIRIAGVIRMQKPEGFDAPAKRAWLNTETRLLIGEEIPNQILPEDGDIRFVGRVVGETATHVDLLLNAFTGSVEAE